MSHHVIFVLVLVATTFLTRTPSSSANPQLIIDTCKNIAQVAPLLKGNYKICVDFLKSDPRSATSTLEGLGEISFELTKKKMVAIESKIKSTLADPKIGSIVKKVLKDCAEMYDEANDSMDEALTAIKRKDLSGANIYTSAAMNAPTDCEDGFEGTTSPLKQVNSELEIFYGIDLVFTHLLKN